MQLLRPAEQFFSEMLDGWSVQQTSRMLASRTISARASQVRRFADFCGTPPWEWAPVDVEEWTTSLVSHHHDGTVEQREEFVATKISHDTTTTRYTVDRTPRPEPTADLGSSL